MSRLEQLGPARDLLGDDFFGGWETTDVETFSRFASQAEPMLGKITDFMGVRTSTYFHPWAAHYDNKVLADLPVPDDFLRAEAIEYFTLFDALQKAPDDSFVMAEVGSSYAPWTIAACVCARRMGKTDVRLAATEASNYLFNLIPKHMAENDLDPADFKLINGAAATERTQLFFPKVTSPGDNGGQIRMNDAGADYVNRNVEYETVEAYPLGDLLPVGMVDLIHMDVQGVEFDILNSAQDLLNQRVRNIFIGTHSRKIEEQLLELFHHEKWELVRERPTRFSYRGDLESIVGWTTRDGGQYWHNPAASS